MFGTFERDDGSTVALLDGYRDAVKRRWRRSWWPVQLLAGLRDRVGLPAEHDALLREIESARTLPVDLREIALAAIELSSLRPEDAIPNGGRDLRWDLPIVELVPSDEQLSAKVAVYRAAAETVRRTAVMRGVDFARARILDVGTGSGYLAFALAGLGAREVVGVDLDFGLYPFSLERIRMSELLAGDAEDRVRLVEADVRALDFPDGAFDVVCSMSVIEHFADLEETLVELRRLLSPKGVMHHGVDPWFGKAGGHSLCTLDFPWGHLRLTDAELERYLRAYRPFEADDALESFHTAFQRPRHALRDSRDVFVDVGLDVIRWRETPLQLRDEHRGVANRGLLVDCRRRYPSVTKRDLLTIGYSVVASR